MSKNNAKAWKTKYGARRVRQEDPTLMEAIAAARDLSDDIDHQVEIAASLIGMPADQVRAELLKAPPRKDSSKSVVFTGPATAQRVVVVETKRPRRVVAR